MKNMTRLVVAIFALSICAAHAQERKKPMTFMNEQLSEQLLNQTISLSDPKLVKAQAELLRQHYSALIEAGFTKSEALQIVVAMSSQDKR